jgi:hypothetical protein
MDMQVSLRISKPTVAQVVALSIVLTGCSGWAYFETPPGAIINAQISWIVSEEDFHKAATGDLAFEARYPLYRRALLNAIAAGVTVEDVRNSRLARFFCACGSDECGHVTLAVVPDGEDRFKGAIAELRLGNEEALSEYIRGLPEDANYTRHGSLVECRPWK